MFQQRTIAEKVSCTGLGLHSGAPVQLTLHPARANAGIAFVRRDGARSIEIPALASSVRSTEHATTLARGCSVVSTVEHVLAALYAFGIDNARVEVDGPEVPVMDGSASSFVYLIRSAGIFVQQEPRSLLRIRRRVEVIDGDRRISIEPARCLRIDYAVQFDHPAIQRQQLSLARVEADDFERELSRARTFGFLDDVRRLWRAGLARGGSLDNTVVLDANQVINPGGLRWPDEFVRHKVLDLVGDLALLGLPIQGHVRVERGGHSLHLDLVRAILSTRKSWSLTGPEPALPPGLDLLSLAPLA